MKILFLVLLCFLPSTSWPQQSDTVRLQFPKSDVRYVLAFYERLSGSSVFMALDMDAFVTIVTEKPISREAALELIRTTLLDGYGIELRAVDQKLTLAAWSKDPKYPSRSDDPLTDEERSALSRGIFPASKPAERK